ncbi:hypothetical protein L204_100070 [Cryptococcus depauperatus]
MVKVTFQTFPLPLFASQAIALPGGSKESGEETQLVDGPANVNPGLDTAHSNPCNLSVDALSTLLAITTTFETYTYTVYDPVTISQVSSSAQIVESTSTLATDSQMAATFSSTSDSGNGSCTDKPNPTGDLLPFSSSQSAIDAIALPTNDSPSSVAGAANGSPAVAASEPSLDSSDNSTVERSGPSSSALNHSSNTQDVYTSASNGTATSVDSWNTTASLLFSFLYSTVTVAERKLLHQALHLIQKHWLRTPPQQ